MILYTNVNLTILSTQGITSQTVDVYYVETAVFSARNSNGKDDLLTKINHVSRDKYREYSSRVYRTPRFRNPTSKHFLHSF